MIESAIDSTEWILECERVASKLKISAQNEPKEWRNHIEVSRQYNEQIKKLLPDARIRLERTSENISKILDKISKSERSINTYMTVLVNIFK